MAVEKIIIDKNGRRVLPPVKIGHEHLSHNSSAVSGDKFVCCNDHGTIRAAWVRVPGPHLSLFKVCKACVKTYCLLSRATRASGVTAENTLENNPEGHSF